MIGHILKECGVRARSAATSALPPDGYDRKLPGKSSGTSWNYRAFNSRPSMSSGADIAVCTNVTPDHLDRHHTLENYAAAKRGCLKRKQPKIMPC